MELDIRFSAPPRQGSATFALDQNQIAQFVKCFIMGMSTKIGRAALAKIGTIILLAFVSSISTPVSAFDGRQLEQIGSLFLDDLMPLIEKRPKLKSQTIESVAKIGKKPEDITCVGQRFSGQWQHLGGMRVAPYTCQIGDQVLEIEANVRLTGKDGREFEKITKDAMKNARNISETELTWKWRKGDVDWGWGDSPLKSDTTVGSSQATPQIDRSNTATVPIKLDLYEVECGILSSEGLPEGSRPRLTRIGGCKLSITVSDEDVTTFDFMGTIYGQQLSWIFEGDAKLNVFKQLAPQTGGKFNRSVTNGRACFVVFDEEGLDDSESMVCYRRSTLRKIHSWDRKSGTKHPIP